MWGNIWGTKVTSKKKKNRLIYETAVKRQGGKNQEGECIKNGNTERQ